MSVQGVMTRAMSSRELDNGVALTFENTDDMARLLLGLVLAERECCAQFDYSIIFEAQHQPIELRVQAQGQLVQPLKSLYLGLLREVGIHAQQSAR